MAIGGLYTTGSKIDWHALAGENARYVKLPSYPWQRELYWSESVAAAADRIGRYDHPLLGAKVAAPAPAWEGTLDRPSVGFLSDHVVDTLVVFPAAAYLEQGAAIQSLME
jgi:acyl transferase domain-containing protein